MSVRLIRRVFQSRSQSKFARNHIARAREIGHDRAGGGSAKSGDRGCQASVQRLDRAGLREQRRARPASCDYHNYRSVVREKRCSRNDSRLEGKRATTGGMAGASATQEIDLMSACEMVDRPGYLGAEPERREEMLWRPMKSSLQCAMGRREFAKTRILCRAMDG